MAKSAKQDGMYVRREPDGSWTLRQERFRHLAKEHPNDVCAVAPDRETLRAMCEKTWPDAFKD